MNFKTAFALILCVFVGVMVAVGSHFLRPNVARQNIRATSAALTQLHGDEVSDAIEGYWSDRVELSEVIVVDYTPSQFRAVACGHIMRDAVQPRDFNSVHVFVREADVWNAAAVYDIGDADGAIRDWAYVDEDTKALLGDIEYYIDNFYAC